LYSLHGKLTGGLFQKYEPWDRNRSPTETSALEMLPRATASEAATAALCIGRNRLEVMIGI
jgi:hypothetical protein